MPCFYMSHNRDNVYETHGQAIFTLYHNRDIKTAVMFYLLIYHINFF